MEHRIAATELARRIGDILNRVVYLKDSFVVERSGAPVARIVPLAETGVTQVREALRAWSEAGPADPGFADDLEEVDLSDRPAPDRWGS